MLKLDDIAQVLGVSKPTASLLRNGRYGEVAGKSDLPARFETLMRLIEQARAAAAPEQLCRDCPREDCTGCRVAEL